MAPRIAALLLAVVGLAACLERGASRGSTRRALGGADAAADLHPTCVKAGYAGCCSASGKLVYCVAGKPLEQSCAPALCGWDPAVSLYACGSSSAPDPSGVHPRACPSPDAGAAADLPHADATHDAGALDARSDAGACGPLGYAGCCAGSKLLYCIAGSILALECGTTAGSCGWNPKSARYECGTSAGQDPSGLHPRACSAIFGDGGPQLDGAPDLPRPDQRVDLPAASDGSAADLVARSERPADLARGRERAASPDARARELAVGLDPSGLDRAGDRPASIGRVSGGGGCSCALGPRGNPSDLLLVLTIGALVAVRLRRARKG